jgi:uncharacterized protein YkwD
MSFFEQLLDRWLRHMPRPAPPKPTPLPGGGSKDSWLAQLLVLRNNERARAGLRPYGVNDKIQSCAVVRDWMNSPGHKQNILGPYPDIGFGYARGLTGNVYWCADFASPMGGRLLDQAIIVEGFGQESVWEPPGRDARA